MQRSSWMIALLSFLLFFLTAWLFYKIGETNQVQPLQARQGEPMVILPLDRESAELLEKLAQSRGEVDRLQEKVATLEAQAMQSDKSDQGLEDELAELRKEMAAQKERDARRLKREQARVDNLQRKFADLSAAHSELTRLFDRRTGELTGLTEPGSQSPAPQTFGSDRKLAEKLQVTTSGDDQVTNARLEDGLAAYKARDYETAYRTWLTLAQKGVGRAQFYIGGLYIDGQGVEQDNSWAHYWLSRAQEAGYAPSTTLLEQVVSIMSAEELAAAEKLSQTQASKSESPGAE